MFIIFRDEAPRPDAASVGPAASRRWVPPSSIKRDAISPEEKNDQVFRRVRGYDFFCLFGSIEREIRNPSGFLTIPQLKPLFK